MLGSVILKAIKKGKLRAAKVDYYSDPRFLLLDYDDTRLDYAFQRRIFQTLRILSIPVRGIAYIRSNKGWHIVIATNTRFKPLETVAIQAIMGSDAKREAMNLGRVRQLKHASKFFKERWNLLFSEKL